MTAKKVVRKPAKAPAKAKAKTTTKKTVKVAKPKTVATPKTQLTAIANEFTVLVKKDPKAFTRAELTKALTSEIAKMKRVIAKL